VTSSPRPAGLETLVPIRENAVGVNGLRDLWRRLVGGKPAERRSGSDRRSGDDRRVSPGEPPEGVERRSDVDRRSGRDRRAG
jgi:hypothetical protein